MVINAGAFSGIEISNNEFYSLRQPLYISGTSTGNVTNNLTYGTKGWVLEGGNLTFTGNTWGTGAQANVYDVAIIPSMPAIYYTDIVAMSNANNGAVIEDQRVSPAVLSVVYVDASTSYAGDFGGRYHPYSSITPAITRVVAGGTIEVAAGTYAEDIIVNKSITLNGPNAIINPCSGIRVGEAIVVPATNAVESGQIFHVTASNVSINGFTIDGDNTSLTSGVTNTTGADMNAAEGVTIYVDNVNNLHVSNNIFKNLSFFGVTLFGESYSAPATSGHIVSNNLFQNMGTYNDPNPDGNLNINNWGGGVLLYNNQYTAITSNCMDNVRLGVQTGNFSRANPGTSAYQLIDNNTMINVRRTGVFHNLHYGPTSAYTISNNSITGVSNVNETKWDGIEFSSLSVPSSASNNIINAGAVTQTSSGYEVWNVKVSTPAAITGGSVTGATNGVFVNNYDGYSSNAPDGAHATVSSITINPSASGTGIRVYDNPSSTHANVQATIGAGVVINNGTNGIVIENTSASVPALGNVAFSGQTGNYIQLISNTNNIDVTTATFGGTTGGSATLAQNFVIEDKIFHAQDNASLGFVTVKAGEDFVTPLSGSVQRGINDGSNGWIVNVAAGTFNEAVNVNKVLTISGAGSGTGGTIITNPGGTAISLGAGTNSSNRVIAQNLRLTGSATGVVVSSYNTLNNIESVSNTVYGINLSSPNDLIVTNSKFNFNQVGLKLALTASATNVSFTDCEFNDNANVGWYADANSSDEPIFDNVTVTNTTFNNNVNKGIYTERLSNAVFNNITVNNSGTGGATNHRAGIDINLKWRTDYTNIQILNSTISNCGTGDANGGGILIKARSDGGTYGANPAALDNVVLSNLFVTNNGGTGTYSSGIRIGEANNSLTGTNTSPTNVSITQCSITGNAPYALRNATTGTTLSATCNWWGSNCPASVGAMINGAVTYSPFLLGGDDAEPVTVGFQTVAECGDGGVLAVTSIDGPDDPVALGTSINITIYYSSANSATPIVDWGDGSTTTETTVSSTSSGSFTILHTYGAAGVYLVSGTLDKSDCQDPTFEYRYVVVYDPSAGFVTGSGWINSPAGAYVATPTLTGTATFGFVSKYVKGKTLPTGNTEFQFNAAGMSFKSTVYDWLVVAGTKAQFKGSGTINGSGDYGFMLSAIDGQITGGGGIDKFRIKIWEKTTNLVVYDNQIGAADNADASTAIGGGSIVIHEVKKAGARTETNPVVVQGYKNFNVKVLGNPTFSYFKLKLESNKVNEKITMRIVDVNGRLIEVKQNLLSGQLIELGSRYNQGVYFAEVIQGDQRKVVKLIKIAQD